MKQEELDNWVGWLQARIPELKSGANEFWIRQALEGYKETKPKKKTKSLEERKKQFFIDVCKHDCDEFASMSFCEFIDYWTEHNEGGKKMRFEMAKNQPFNIKRRLATWKRNQKNYNNGTTTKQTRIDAFKDVYKSGEL